MPDCAGVAQLAGKAVVAVYHLSVDHDAGAHAGAQGDHDEILHTAGGAIGHLSHGGGIGVVGEGDGNAVHLLAKELGEFHLVVTPLEVGSALDGAGVIVSVGRTNADTADAAFGLGLCHNAVKGFCQFRNERFYFLISIRTDNGLCHNGTTGVHNATFGGLATYIYTNN